MTPTQKTYNVVWNALKYGTPYTKADLRKYGLSAQSATAMIKRGMLAQNGATYTKIPNMISLILAFKLNSLFITAKNGKQYYVRLDNSLNVVDGFNKPVAIDYNDIATVLINKERVAPPLV